MLDEIHLFDGGPRGDHVRCLLNRIEIIRATIIGRHQDTRCAATATDGALGHGSRSRGRGPALPGRAAMDGRERAGHCRVRRQGVGSTPRFPRRLSWKSRPGAALASLGRSAGAQVAALLQHAARGRADRCLSAPESGLRSLGSSSTTPTWIRPCVAPWRRILPRRARPSASAPPHWNWASTSAASTMWCCWGRRRRWARSCSASAAATGAAIGAGCSVWHAIRWKRFSFSAMVELAGGRRQQWRQRQL